MKLIFPSIYHLTLTVFCSIVFLSFTANAQYQQFSFTQNISNPITFNPAYSVKMDEANVEAIVRKQWVGVPGAPTTYALNASMPISSINGAAGITVLNDTYTIEKNALVNVFFAKAIKLSYSSSLAVSLNVGVRNYEANYTSANSADGISVDNLFANNINEVKPNLGLSMLFYGDKYQIGLSAPQIVIKSFGNQSAQSAVNNYYLSAGYTTRDDDDLKVSYAGLMSYANNQPIIADVSVLTVIKKQLGLGVNYRTNNEIAGIFSIDFDKIHLGYSYQFGLQSSNLGSFNNATHEVVLGIRFGKAK